MLRTVFGALLLVHGLIHLAWFAPKPPDDVFPFRWDSPLFPKADERRLRATLSPVIVTLVAVLALSALGVWGVPGLASVWVPTAVAGASLSFVVMAVLWHPWFVTGPFVNVLIVAFALLGLLDRFA